MSLKNVPFQHSADYRADVDGLRAIAVLAVVFYHAGVVFVGGGFIGVDIFFVISGYLISGIIFRGLNSGNFSFAHFYEKRIKRIFPPLIFLLFVVSGLGRWILLPDDFKLLCRDIAAGAAFIANIATWDAVDYFDRAAIMKPLLHLWSLGIEEQFYIIWPFLAVLAWRRRLLGWLLLITATTSFVVNVAIVRHHASAAFYLPMGRFWELLLGAGLAYLEVFKPSLIKDRLHVILQRCLGRHGQHMTTHDLMAWSGLYLLLIGLILIKADSRFPGWWALLPTCGAGLLIAAGPHCFINRRWLAHKYMVAIGLISYPLYLWHWPLLVFCRVMFGSHPAVWVRSVAVTLAFLLAYLSTRFIERPIRFPQRSVNRRLIIVSLSLLLVLAFEIGCIGYFSAAGGHFSLSKERQRFADIDANNYNQHRRDYQKCTGSLRGNIDLNWCLLSNGMPPTAAIFGDSHGEAVFAGIAATDRQRSWLLIGESSCPPTNGVRAYNLGEDEDCLAKTRQALEIIIQQPTIQTVVVVSFGFYFTENGFAAEHVGKLSPKNYMLEWAGDRPIPDDKAEIFYRGLHESVRKLLHAGKRVVFYMDVPEVPFMPKECLATPMNLNIIDPCSIDASMVQLRQRHYRDMVQRLQSANPGLEVFDPLPHLCQNGACVVGTADTMYYRDSHHLSLRGSTFLAAPLLAKLKSAPSKTP